MEAFFLPLIDPTEDHANASLRAFFQRHMLARAPVSEAARRFVADLRALGWAPDEWRDRHARPLLVVAAQWNYVRLFKWLVAQGCSVAATGYGPELLAYAQMLESRDLEAFIADRLAEEGQHAAER